MKHNSSDLYTQEQLVSVNRIKNCKNYYEVLGVTINVTEEELKKRYRKMALQFHPDKNKAPGANEAFNAVGNAFSVLSDPSKRKKYDQQELNNSTFSNGHDGWYNPREFEDGTSPDDVFNKFFNFQNGKEGRSFRTTAHTFRRYKIIDRQDGCRFLVQLSPIMILLALTIGSVMLGKEDAYSLTADSKYTTEMFTARLKVPYYVKPHFKSISNIFPRNYSQIEDLVEQDYIKSLQDQCQKEKSRQEIMLKMARRKKNKTEYRTAKKLKNGSCKILETILL